MKARLIIVTFLVAAIGMGAWWYVTNHASHENGQIRVSGNIEVTDVAVAFKISGRVEQRPVDEGQFVRQGALVAVLDSTDLGNEVARRRAELQAAEAALAELLAGSRKEEIAAAEAAMQKAAAALQELETGSRPQEIRAAEAVLASAVAEKDRMEAEFGRAAKLFERNSISREEYDRVRAGLEVAGAKAREAGQQLDLVREGPRVEDIQQARQALAQARAQYDLVKAGPRQETIDQARARVAQAQAALALAQTNLGYATLVSPLSGMVLSKNVEAGEYVAPGTPVVTVGDLVHVWLRAYINETDLTRVKRGQRARVTTDAYQGKVYEGYVAFIADDAEFTPKNVQTEKERVKLVYRIKINIVNPNQELKPGMPADAVILAEEAPAAPAASTPVSAAKPQS